MDCRKTQRLFDEFAEGRLAAPLAEQLQRHLTDCTDCRVAQQRAARLRRLLSLKRHEQPTPIYFQGFLDEFHRRLQTEPASPSSLWIWLKTQWEDFRRATPVWTLRYGLTSAAGVLLMAGIASWMVVHQTKPMVVERGAAPIAGQNVNSISPTDNLPMLVAQETPAAFTPLTRDIPTDATTHVVLVPAATREAGAPRYVLDHLAITPASYEGPRVNF
jgi:hypothetical protein